MKRSGFKKKPKTFKKPKVKSTGFLKRKADHVVSVFIRQHYADKDGMVSCYTCPIRKHWKEMQCGHFVSRKYLATRFYLPNLRVQCVGCNVFGDGMIPIFAEKLEQETSGIVAELYKMSQTIKPMRSTDYQDIIDTYSPLLWVPK